MNLQIQVLSTSVETKPTAKGSYQIAEVAYKNLTFQGKVEAKKLMSFGTNAAAFKEMVLAQAGSVWEVDVVKNEKGYNDWVKVTKSTGAAPNASAPQGTSAQRAITPTKSGGNWETPEERAKKQVYIIRQSSLNVATTALTASAKTGYQPTADEIIDLAKKLENYVLDLSIAEPCEKQDTSLEAGGDDLTDLPW